MKPKPFDALNHFTLPVGTGVSPMSAFWISPRPSFRREAIGRSLLRSIRGKKQVWEIGVLCPGVFKRAINAESIQRKVIWHPSTGTMVFIDKYRLAR